MGEVYELISVADVTSHVHYKVQMTTTTTTMTDLYYVKYNFLLLCSVPQQDCIHHILFSLVLENNDFKATVLLVSILCTPHLCV